MADKIIRVLAKDAPVKASAITAKEMVKAGGILIPWRAWRW